MMNMMIHSRLICCFVLIGLSGCGSDTANPASKAPPASTEAAPLNPVDILIQCRYITTHHVGEDGRPSRSAWAFTELLRGGDPARHVFDFIFRHAEHPAGRVYALAALHELAPEEYERLQQSLETDQEVPVMNADIEATVSMGTLRQLIESGQFYERAYLKEIVPVEDTVFITALHKRK